MHESGAQQHMAIASESGAPHMRTYAWAGLQTNGNTCGRTARHRQARHDSNNLRSTRTMKRRPERQAGHRDSVGAAAGVPQLTAAGPPTYGVVRAVIA